MNNPFESIDLRLLKIESLLAEIMQAAKEPPPEIDKPLAIEEAADLLKLSKQTIYKYVREHEIPFSKKGKRLYFSKAEILEWIKEGRKKTLSEIKAETHTYLKRKGTKHGR